MFVGGRGVRAPIRSRPAPALAERIPDAVAAARGVMQAEIGRPCI